MTRAPSFLMRMAEPFSEHELVVPTGVLVACDGLIVKEKMTLNTRVAPGRYRVRVGKVDRDNAWAMLVVSDAPVVTWKPDDAREGRALGHPVDSGTSCFADLVAARAHLASERAEIEAHSQTVRARGIDPADTAAWHRAMSELSEAAETLYERFARAGLEKKGVASQVFDEATGANSIAFHSGAGDGVYITWIGLDAKGGVARIVTDLGVLVDEEDEASEEAAAAAPVADPVDAAKRLLALLARNGHIELRPGTTLDARAVAHQITRGAAKLHAWLLDRPEIDEVFISEEEFEVILAEW